MSLAAVVNALAQSPGRDILAALLGALPLAVERVRQRPSRNEALTHPTGGVCRGSAASASETAKARPGRSPPRYARLVRELIAAVPVLDALQRFTVSLQDVRPIHGIDVPSGDRPPEAGRVTLGSLMATAQGIYNAVTALNREIRRFYENPVTVEAVRKIVDKPWLLSCGGAIAHLHHELPAASEFLPKDLEALGVVLGLDSDPRVDANHDKWRKRLPEVREAAAALDRSLFPSSRQNDFDPPDLTGLLRS